MNCLSAAIESDDESDTGSVRSGALSRASTKDDRKSDKRISVRRKHASLPPAGVDDIDKMKVFAAIEISQFDVIVNFN